MIQVRFTTKEGEGDRAEPAGGGRAGYQTAGHTAVRSAGGLSLLMSKLVNTASKHAGQMAGLARRRAEMRYSTEMNVRLLTEPPGHAGLPMAGSRVYVAYMFDLSYTGAGLISNVPVRINDRLWISLQTFGFDGLWVQGKVVNIADMIDGVRRIGVTLELGD